MLTKIKKETKLDAHKLQEIIFQGLTTAEYSIKFPRIVKLTYKDNRNWKPILMYLQIHKNLQNQNQHSISTEKLHKFCFLLKGKYH